MRNNVDNNGSNGTHKIHIKNFRKIWPREFCRLIFFQIQDLNVVLLGRIFSKHPISRSVFYQDTPFDSSEHDAQKNQMQKTNL